MARSPGIFPEAPHVEIARKLSAAGKLVILQSQMTWILGNFPACRPIEVFASQLKTPAPITGFQRPMPGAQGPVVDDVEFVEGTVPRTLEAWIHAQKSDQDFAALLGDVEDKALKQELWIRATPHDNPTIIVPRSYQEILVRDTHHRMFHLAHAKIFALLRRSYYWKSMKTDVRKFLEDCPQCELNKARQNTAHGPFSAAPAHAPRSKWCMDFQGQGTALTGETEALALIDPISRYVVVIPLKDREARTWIQPFLDRIVFTFGPPDVLHSDAAPEFLSEALALVAKATDISTTTTLAHNARGNGTIEIFWRFWNRCLRLLPDDHYRVWPSFASRICFAFNSAGHDSIAGVTPFQVYHGAPARNPFSTLLLEGQVVDEDRELQLPAEFADAVAVSTQSFANWQQHTISS
jgi:transposase InsO family protein